MHVSAKDLATGREQKMTVTGGSALPKDDIDRMMREAEQYAEEDHKRREAAETRNQGEQLVYQTEKFLRENEDKVPAETRAEVGSAITELKEQLEQNAETNVLRTGIEKLATVSQKMGQAMYAQSQQTPPTARPTPALAPSRAPRRTTTWSTRRSSTTRRTSGTRRAGRLGARLLPAAPLRPRPSCSGRGCGTPGTAGTGTAPAR